MRKPKRTSGRTPTRRLPRHRLRKSRRTWRGRRPRSYGRCPATCRARSALAKTRSQASPSRIAVSISSMRPGHRSWRRHLGSSSRRPRRPVTAMSSSCRISSAGKCGRPSTPTSTRSRSRRAKRSAPVRPSARSATPAGRQARIFTSSYIADSGRQGNRMRSTRVHTSVTDETDVFQISGTRPFF